MHLGVGCMRSCSPGSPKHVESTGQLVQWFDRSARLPPELKASLMNKRTFWRLVGSLIAIQAGCAESAIPPEDVANADSETGGTDSTGEDVGLDASSLDSGANPPRDAGNSRVDASPSSDGALTAGDGGSRSAGGDAGLDAGRSDGGGSPDAGRDAGSSGQSDAGGPVSCANGQTTCGGSCVDTTRDPAHCGGCDQACASGQTCESNQCVGGAPTFKVPSGCTKMTLGQHGYAFCTNGRSWRDARSACLDAGLDLVIITDKAENDFVKANGDSWIAANDRSSEGRFQQVVPGNADRVDGATASYTSWHSGEPNNNTTCGGFEIPVIGVCAGQTTDEDCGMIYADGTWNDGACEERKGFVCETY